jgi:hypothetical protein
LNQKKQAKHVRDFSLALGISITYIQDSIFNSSGRKRLNIIFLSSLTLFMIFSSAVGQTISPPYALSYRIENDSVHLLWYYPGVNTRTCLNDRGEADNYYLVSTQDVGARVVVEFTNLVPNSPIESISLFIWGADPRPDLPGGPGSVFRLGLFDHLGTDTNETALWGPFPLFAENVPAQGKWEKFGAGGVLTSTGKLYAEFIWLKSTPTAPLPALDYASGECHTSFGYFNNGQIEWHTEYGGNLLLRINYNLPDTLPEYSTPANQPDSFGIYVSADSLDHTAASNPTYIVRDSLHLSAPFSNLSGTYISVVAYQAGKSSAPSSPIYLDVATEVHETPTPRGIDLGLQQNSPNPFNSNTAIISNSPASIIIYDILGRKVAELSADRQNSNNRYSFDWNGCDEHGSVVASGVYFYRQKGNQVTRKMIFLK